MNATIFKVLQALNELEVRGEQNHNLLLFAIQQLKPLQTAIITQAQEAGVEGHDDDN